MKRKIAKGEIKRLLLVIGQLQNMIGHAEGLHHDDRSQNAYTELEKLLEDAFEICVNVRGDYEIVEENK